MAVVQRTGADSKPRISCIVLFQSQKLAMGRLLRQQSPLANARGYYIFAIVQSPSVTILYVGLELRVTQVSYILTTLSLIDSIVTILN